MTKQRHWHTFAGGFISIIAMEFPTSSLNAITIPVGASTVDAIEEMLVDLATLELVSFDMFQT